MILATLAALEFPVGLAADGSSAGGLVVSGFIAVVFLVVIVVIAKYELRRR
jgi:hypothetical protein